ncbi:hypothetical protein [Parasphingorhabdus pacifica]
MGDSARTLDESGKTPVTVLRTWLAEGLINLLQREGYRCVEDLQSALQADEYALWQCKRIGEVRHREIVTALELWAEDPVPPHPEVPGAAYRAWVCGHCRSVRVYETAAGLTCPECHTLFTPTGLRIRES